MREARNLDEGTVDGFGIGQQQVVGDVITASSSWWITRPLRVTTARLRRG